MLYPGTYGILGRKGLLPMRTATSSWHTGVARILTRASPTDGGRRSFSMISRTSGPPLLVTMMLLYFMASPVPSRIPPFAVDWGPTGTGTDLSSSESPPNLYLYRPFPHKQAECAIKKKSGASAVRIGHHLTERGRDEGERGPGLLSIEKALQLHDGDKRRIARYEDSLVSDAVVHALPPTSSSLPSSPLKR